MKEGFIRGKASPCNFWHKERNLRAVVHGDDFTVLGWEKSLNWFWERIHERFDCKHRGRLGAGDKDVKEIRILNRIITWTASGIEYEGDQRHVEIAQQSLQLTGESKGVVTPADKSQLKGDENKPLTRQGKKQFRGLVARMNSPRQERHTICGERIEHGDGQPRNN